MVSHGPATADVERLKEHDLTDGGMWRLWGVLWPKLRPAVNTVAFGCVPTVAQAGGSPPYVDSVTGPAADELGAQLVLYICLVSKRQSFPRVTVPLCPASALTLTQ